MMARALSLAGVGAGIAVIGAAVWWLSGGFESRIPPGEEAAVAMPSVAGGEIFTAIVERAPTLEWVSGTVASARQTAVAARVLARIEGIHVRAGDDVAAGDTVVTLDGRDLSARLEQVRKQLEAAEAQRALARTERGRVAELVERGWTTRERFDQVVSRLQVAEADVERLRQALTEAETARSFTDIRAPLSGRVVDRLAEPGDMAVPGRALLRIYDPLSLRVEAPVRESLAARLAVGDSVAVQVPAIALEVTGTIEEIVPFADPGARTLLVKVRLPADTGAFAGMFARVAVPAGERSRLIVPAGAVERLGQLEFVTIVDEAGVATRRLVTTGQHLDGDRVEVLSGLKSGERVHVPDGA